MDLFSIVGRMFSSNSAFGVCKGLLALGTLVFICWTGANADEEKETSSDNAGKRQATVISCRDVVDNSGYDNPNKKGGFWRIIDGAPSASELFGNEESGSVAVVFVHGYNTSLSEAVEDGNKLWFYLRSAANEEARSRMPAASRLEKATFFTFCWHGDFGTLNYPLSVGVAEVSGSSLASFLKEMHSQALRRHQSPRLIVITHSLGASVALEAFKSLTTEQTNGWVTCTLLVQPAIELKSILRQHFGSEYVQRAPMIPHRFSQITGKFETPRPTAFLNSSDHDFIDPYDEDGEYYRACDFSARIIVAMSSADDILEKGSWNYLFSSPYRWYSHPFWSPWRWANATPDIFESLGGTSLEICTAIMKGRVPDFPPPFKPEYLKFPSNFKALDFSDPKGNVFVHEHDQLFKDPGYVAALYKQLLDSLPISP
jgi:Alpha/beta hydrolase of unknown function (DUF900)